MMFNHIARFFGLQDPGDTVPPPPPPPDPKLGPVPLDNDNPFSPLWHAVGQHIEHFATQVVGPHRFYEPDDVFALARIQVKGLTSEANELLSRYLAEFKPDSRRKNVLSAVSQACPSGISAAQFIEFNHEFSAEDLQHNDPYRLAENDGCDFSVTLYGEWVRELAAAAAAAAAVPDAAILDLAEPLVLLVQDAKGTRNVTVSRLPWVLGREHAQSELAICGTFVSRRHGVIDLGPGGRLRYRDTSANGSAVDGVAALASQHHNLRDGSCMTLGGPGAPVADCPVLTVLSGAGTALASTPIRAPADLPVHATTPLRPSESATAVTPTVFATPPRCLLAVQDANGSQTVAVTRLPYTIGRDPGHSEGYRVPEANAGVSRVHLVIVAVDAVGAHVIQGKPGEPAAWGTQVADAEQPVEFVLPWRAKATLAARYRKTSPVCVQLLPPEQ